MLITSLDHPLRRGDIVNLDKVVVSTARTQAEKVAMFADGKSFDHSLAIVLVLAIIRKRSFLNFEPVRATSSAPQARIFRPIMGAGGDWPITSLRLLPMA